MKNIQITQLDKTELESLIQNAVSQGVREAAEKEFESRIYSIKEVMEKTGKSYEYVKKKIRDGFLIPTADGKSVSGAELNKFLGKINAVSGENETA
jgi:hypothetical protein